MRRVGVVVLLLSWLAVFASRPFTLGFYLDDWSVFLDNWRQTGSFTREHFAWLMTVYANRPVVGLQTWLISSLAGDSPAIWHLAMALITLATALAIRALLRSLLRLLDWTPLWTADLATALWLAFPWMLGSTAWPTLGPCLVAAIGFSMCGKLLFDDWRAGRSRWLAPAAWFTVGGLSYEAFYGQFVLLFIIALACGAARRVGWRPLVRSGAALAVAQLLLIAQNRVVPLFNEVAPSKAFNAAWPAKLVDNLGRLPYVVAYSSAEVSPALELALAAGGLALAVALPWLVARPATRRDGIRAAAVLFAVGMGALMSLTLLAVTHYGVSGTGLASRSTMALSLWLAIALTVGIALGARQRRLAPVVTSYALVLLGLFTYATQARLDDWAGAWRVQRDTIAAAPVEQWRDAPAMTAVLLEAPYRHEGVVTFSARWDLLHAMHYAFPELRHIAFYPARRDWVTRWDGQVLTQADGGVEYRSEASELWVWRGDDGTTQRVAPPFIHPSQVTAR